MASKSELWTQLRCAIKLFDSLYTYSTGIFFINYKLLQDELYGSHTANTATKIDTVKLGLSTVISADYISQIILELARVGYSSTTTDIPTALANLAQGMTDASETIKSRTITYNSITNNAGNVGDGNLLRCVKTKHGDISEGCSLQHSKIKAEITADSKTSGLTLLDKENFILKGDGNIGVDAIDVGDTTSEILSGTVRNWSTSGGNLATNGNFLNSTTGVRLYINNWTLADDNPANVAIDTSTIYNAQTYSVKMLANNKISQPTTLGDKTKPFFVIVPLLKGTAGSDGNVIISLGSKSLSAITVSSLSTTNWTVAIFGTDENGFYDNWKQLNSEVSVELTGATTGHIFIGGILLAQPDEFDGNYYLMHAGSVPMQVGDYWFVTDSCSNTGRIQSTIARLYGTSLPHASSGETYGDF